MSLFLNFLVAPKIQLSGPQYPVLEGGNVTLTCIVHEGYPKPRIQWFKDKMPLEREINTTLVLTQIKADDEGNYTCNAENGLGVSNDSMFVIVDSE